MQRLARTLAVAALGLVGWGAGAALSPGHASACLISPGTTTCAPDVLSVDSSAVLVGQKSGTIVSTPDGTVHASYIEQVWRDPSNALGSCAPNCLTWTLEIQNLAASTEVIERITIASFSGFLTDMGIATSAPPGAPPPGTIPPANVERSSGTGAVLAWDFNTTTSEIQPTQTTVLLEAETNSTTIKMGTVSVQDGEAGSGPGLAPAVPEALWVPAIGLLGGAFAGGWMLRKRRRRQTVS